MTYTFKLSRRLAILYTSAMLPLFAVIGACAGGELLESGHAADAVEMVVTVPDSVIVETNQPVVLRAYGRNSDGDSIATDVEWFSVGGDITTGGRFISAAAGRFKVIGKRRGRHAKPDTSTVIVVPPAPALSAIVVTPESVTLAPGTRRTFSARGVRNDGSTTQIGVLWSAAGGSIDAAGTYTAGATPGRYRVHATTLSTEQADSATVTITGSPSNGPTVAAIVLAPLSVSLHLGATQRFSASARMSDGTTKVIPVTYSGTGGTITAAGLYTAGRAIGTYRVVATQSGGGLADTAQVSVVAPPPSGPPLPSGVSVFPGDDLRAAVSASPAGTVFILKAGVHRRQSVVPKDGMQFIGEPGAVLDGEGVTLYAFETLTSHPRNVVIRNLVIERYAPPSQRGAIQGDNGVDWRVEGNEVRHNTNMGVRVGTRMRLLNNHVHHNGKLGVAGYRADDVLVEGNEVSYNNTSHARETAELAEASGMKFVATQRLTVRANHVHHNNAKGIWTDHAYLGTLIEGNTVTDNAAAGIWHEASYDAIIRNNVVERNGAGYTPRWLEAAGIQVTNSRDVQVYGNTVRNNANGIGVMQASGYADGPYGPKVVENLHVHDNVIEMTRGRTGLAQNLGDRSYYTSRNNRFGDNTYYLGTSPAYFLYDERNLTEAAWRSAGNDVSGVFHR